VKMLKIRLLGASWGHLVAKAPKYSKQAFWEPLEAIWWPRHQNAQKEPSWGLLGAFGGQGTKMLQMGLLGASWGRLMAKAPKCSQIPFLYAQSAVLCAQNLFLCAQGPVLCVQGPVLCAQGSVPEPCSVCPEPRSVHPEPLSVRPESCSALPAPICMPTARSAWPRCSQQHVRED